MVVFFVYRLRRGHCSLFVCVCVRVCFTRLCVRYVALSLFLLRMSLEKGGGVSGVLWMGEAPASIGVFFFIFAIRASRFATK